MQRGFRFGIRIIVIVSETFLKGFFGAMVQLVTWISINNTQNYKGTQIKSKVRWKKKEQDIVK